MLLLPSGRPQVTSGVSLMPSVRTGVLGVAFVAVVGGMAQGPTAANPQGALAAALDCGDCQLVECLGQG